MKMDILLEPSHLGPDMKRKVEQQVTDEVEGKCMGKYGYVIRVIGIDHIAPGLIDNDTGSVSVNILYSCIMLRPFKNEILDAIIFNAADDSGFFARVGPLEIYVHKYNMPEDMRFDHQAGDAWVSEDGDIDIREGSIVRLRIIGVSVDAGQMNAVATIKDSHLGQLE
jgi:DNA-directed RNA polymerase II subunit RPB7